IDRVHTDVVERAAMLARLEIPCRPLVENERMLREERERADLPDRAVGDQLADAEVSAMIAQIQQAADDAPLFGRDRLDSLQLSQVGAEWFVRKHMLAGGKSGNDQL